MLKIAAYCPDKSRQAGTSESQYRAGIQLVREAICDMSRIDVRQIEVTKQDRYRVWWRLKLKNAPAVSYRAIVEITGTEVNLHVILPRCFSTYRDVEQLWKAYRVVLPDKDDR